RTSFGTATEQNRIAGTACIGVGIFDKANSRQCMSSSSAAPYPQASPLEVSRRGIVKCERDRIHKNLKRVDSFFARRLGSAARREGSSHVTARRKTSASRQKWA